MKQYLLLVFITLSWLIGYSQQNNIDWVIQPNTKYKEAGSDFKNGLSVVRNNEKEGIWLGVIDKSEKLIVPFDYRELYYSDGLFRYLELKPYSNRGFLNNKGEKIITADSWRNGNVFSEGLAAVEKNLQWGYIDKTNKIVIDYEYEYAGEFNEGLALVKKNRKYGYIDKTGNVVIPFSYIGRPFSEGLARVNIDNGKDGYIDKTGKLIIPMIYEDGGDFKDGCVQVKKTKHGYYGYIDKKGRAITEFKYKYAYDFSEGLAAAKETPNDITNIINTQGQVVFTTPYYTSQFNGFSEGLIMVRDKNDKYGFLDAKGEVVIPLVLDGATSFSDGVAWVKKGDSWGVIRNPLGPKYPLPKYPPILNISNVTFKDADGNQMLDALEQGVLSFDLKNIGNGSAYGIKVNVEPKTNNKYIKLEQIKLIDSLSTNSFYIVIPISATKSIPTSTTIFDIIIKEYNGFDVNAKVSIPTFAFKEPNFTLADPNFTTKSGGQIQKGIPITFQTLVKNSGQGEAKDVGIAFTIPDNVFAAGDKTFNLGTLQAGEGKVVQFEFFANNRYQGTDIPINYTITESYGEYGTKGTQIVTLNQSVRPTEEVVIKPIRPTDDRPKDNLTLLWVSPDPTTLNNKPLALETEQVSIKLKAVSSQPLADRHFTIYVNGKPQIGKSGEVDLRRNLGSNNTYTFEAIATVPSGTSTIEVEANNAAGKQRATPLNVIYSAGKSNLHILAIGTNPVDLNFPQKDAQDFAHVFRNQSGADKIFAKIQTTAILGDEATATNIQQNIKRLRFDFQDGIIKPNDVVMVFISAHGYIETDKDNQFRIQASDFNGAYYETTSVSYDYITKQLNKISCKKMIFIDACHSGGAKANAQAINDAITRIGQRQDGITTITSSTENQKSYEHTNWKNGAFTKALLEGLSKKSDTNRNGIITVSELFEYLEKRVPELTNKEYQQAQNPQITRDDLGDLPVFVY